MLSPFNSLGMDIPLFHRAITQGEEITAPAGPANVPDRLRRRVLCEDLQKGVGAQYYGAGASLALYLGGALLNTYQIKVADLSGPEGNWANLPAKDNTYLAVVDPELGRIAVAPPSQGPVPTLTASYYYGFNAPMGGGDYPRAEGFLVSDAAWVLPFPDTDNPPRYGDLQGAVTQTQTLFALNGAIAIEIASSDTLTLSGALEIDVPAGATLELRAAQGQRPTLLLDGELQISGDAGSAFALNGLVLAASAGMTPPSSTALLHVPKQRVAPGNGDNLLETLNLTDCTLVPGWSVDASGAPRHADAPVALVELEIVAVTITRSILGAMQVAALATASLSDSIVDATDPTKIAYVDPKGTDDPDGTDGGGALTLSGCTLVGKVHARELTLVSDSIFWGALAPVDSWASALLADRRQAGCVRFSFLPIGALTPRKFKCVERALAAPHPLFFSLRYGDPAYLKLLTSTDDTIRRGADDGGEMGAFHFVQAPQRETDLKIRLQEYLPVGLDFGLIYQT